MSTITYIPSQENRETFKREFYDFIAKAGLFASYEEVTYDTFVAWIVENQVTAKYAFKSNLFVRTNTKSIFITNGFTACFDGASNKGDYAGVLVSMFIDLYLNVAVIPSKSHIEKNLDKSFDFKKKFSGTKTQSSVVKTNSTAADAFIKIHGVDEILTKCTCLIEKFEMKALSLKYQKELHECVTTNTVIEETKKKEEPVVVVKEEVTNTIIEEEVVVEEDEAI